MVDPCTDLLSIRPCGHRGRNVCLAFLAQLHCAGCNYSHERHDVATLDDDELAPIVQQKLQEIQSWFTRTQQWSFSPAPVAPIPFVFAPPSGEDGDDHQQPPCSAETQEQAKGSTSSFADTDPSKVVEFIPSGLLQLPTPTSPKSQESLSGAPNEETPASTMESTEDNAAFDAIGGWGHATNANGDGWFTPESNWGTNTEAFDATGGWGHAPNANGDGRFTPESNWGTNTEDKKPEEYPEAEDKKPEECPEGKESEAKFDWAEDAERTLLISPLKEEEPKDISWDIPPSNEKWGANEHDWNTVPSKGKRSKWDTKEKSTPKDKDNWFHKESVEKKPDRKARGNGWKEEGLIGSTGGKKGKKGAKPSLAAKPGALSNTKFGSTKEKCRDQAAGPKDAFTFNRLTPSSSTATAQSTRKDEDEEVDPDSLPELPPDHKNKDYPPEFETILRQAVVPRRKIPNRPSVAPLPENTNSDKGMSWVNGGIETGWGVGTPKDSPERKDETSGWNLAHGKRSKTSKASPPGKEDWPKLGK